MTLSNETPINGDRQSESTANVSQDTVSSILANVSQDTVSSILIIDNESADHHVLQSMLEQAGYVTTKVTSSDEALASISWNSADLIVLNTTAGRSSASRLARILKAKTATFNIPVLVVNAQEADESALRNVTAGGSEFAATPMVHAALSNRVRNLLGLISLERLHKNHALVLDEQVQHRAADLHRFRLAMDASADAIVLVDHGTMRFIDANATAHLMFGYSRNELLGMRATSLGAIEDGQLNNIYNALIAGQNARGSEETSILRKDGTRLEVDIHRRVRQSEHGWTIVVTVRDITERKHAERQLHNLAHYDPLTGLANRTLFHATLVKELAQAARNGWEIAVLFLDLDHFKAVNDTLGHAIGDELLVQVSRRLVNCVRIGDTVGRLGGDEFALILLMKDGEKNAGTVANKIKEALRTPFQLKGQIVSVTASIGIAGHPFDSSVPDDLLKYADTAMYRAKRAGHDTYRFFTAEMNIEAAARLELETALRLAVEKNQFVLLYQPRANLKTGRITGVEALLRWQRPGHGLVPPSVFLASLEDTGLIMAVGRWVIAEACRQMAIWRRRGIGDIQISVNISMREFLSGELDALVDRCLRDHDVPPDMLELELTECSLMTNPVRTAAIMESLRKRGVGIAIDDFGTGFSSLASLRRFPIDRLKIDISFIRDIATNRDDAAIVLAMIRMAHSLKLEVIAKGVEIVAQLNCLRRNRCDHIQGYYVSPPLPLHQLEQILQADKYEPVLTGITCTPSRRPRNAQPLVNLDQ